jgi:hypothetical protein
MFGKRNVIITVAMSIMAIAVFLTAAHSTEPTMASPSLGYSPAITPYNTQTQPTQDASLGRTIFVGSVVKNYDGRQFKVNQDGTLSPLVEGQNPGLLRNTSSTGI